MNIRPSWSNFLLCFGAMLVGRLAWDARKFASGAWLDLLWGDVFSSLIAAALFILILRFRFGASKR